MRRLLSITALGMASLLSLSLHAQMRGSMGGRGSGGSPRASSGFSSGPRVSPGFRSGPGFSPGFRSGAPGGPRAFAPAPRPGGQRFFSPARTSVGVRSFAPSHRGFSRFPDRRFGVRRFHNRFHERFFFSYCFDCFSPFFSPFFFLTWVLFGSAVYPGFRRRHYM